MITPDPFIFNATMEQFKYFSNYNRTCMLWCVQNSNLCAGASILDSDLWEIGAQTSGDLQTKISGHWRVVSPGKLVLLYSESQVAFSGPEWFSSLSKS